MKPFLILETVSLFLAKISQMKLKSILILGCVSLLSSYLSAQTQVDLSYYLPQNIEFNSAIPKPSEVIHFTPGNQHVSHDRLVQYMYALADASPRIHIENRGFTYENRPLILLTITSEKNHENLAEIKNNRNLLINGKSDVDISEVPVVINQGYSVHGNEPSGSNAALVYAYYLAAAEGEEIQDFLNHTIILLDPCFNPDGLQRFASWVNTNKSEFLNPDANDREFSETWPRGRTNHYWFDLNRDWLPVQHPSSQTRIKTFHEWKPNVLTDHHEMYPNSTFFFQPGIPERTHPLTPQKNQELTQKIANFHAASLDEAGSFYYTKESFDDFYYGKGSTFPDIHGSVGILFEQASSRGHVQETDFGNLSFPFTVKNQFLTSLSTLKASVDLRENLLNYQRDFYKNSIENAEDDAYLIAKKNDPFLVNELGKILQQHQIKIHRPSDDVTIKGNVFPKHEVLVVPKKQMQAKLIEAMFEDRTQFKDSLFYDVSAFSFKHSFGVALDQNFPMKKASGEITELETQFKHQLRKSDYAYVLRWSDFNAPKVLFTLLDKGLRPRVANKQFKNDTTEFDYGSILIPVQNQVINSSEIFELLSNLASENTVNITPITSGLTEGVSLGSPSFQTLQKPKIALLVGDGVSVSDAGEIWHLLDYRYEIPVTKLDTRNFSRVDLSKYTHLIIPNAYGNGINTNTDQIKTWVQNGGHLISFRNSISWLKSSNLINAELKKQENTEAKNVSYDNRRNYYGAQRIGGAIFEVNLDRTHPINFGFTTSKMAVFRNTTQFLEPDKDSFNNPIQYSENPLLSGYISEENLALLKNTSAFKTAKLGSGKVIYFTDNPNFRAFWLGTSKLMMNAIFFSNDM